MIHGCHKVVKKIFKRCFGGSHCKSCHEVLSSLGKFPSMLLCPHISSRYEAKFGAKIGKSRMTKWFDKMISKLERGWNILSIKQTKGCTFTNLVRINFNVLVLSMKGRINYHI